MRWYVAAMCYLSVFQYKLSSPVTGEQILQALLGFRGSKSRRLHLKWLLSNEATAVWGHFPDMSITKPHILNVYSPFNTIQCIIFQLCSQIVCVYCRSNIKHSIEFFISLHKEPPVQRNAWHLRLGLLPCGNNREGLAKGCTRAWLS